MSEWLGNSKLESVWKEPVRRNVSYYPDTCEEETSVKIVPTEVRKRHLQNSLRVQSVAAGASLIRESDDKSVKWMIYCGLKDKSSVVDRGYLTRSWIHPGQGFPKWETWVLAPILGRSVGTLLKKSITKTALPTDNRTKRCPLHADFLLSLPSTLKMEAILSPETSIDIPRTAVHMADDRIHHNFHFGLNWLNIAFTLPGDQLELLNFLRNRLNRISQDLRFSQQSSACCYLLHTGFLFGLVLGPEDTSEMFLRNIGLILTEYIMLYSRRYNPPK